MYFHQKERYVNGVSGFHKLIFSFLILHFRSSQSRLDVILIMQVFNMKNLKIVGKKNKSIFIIPAIYKRLRDNIFTIVSKCNGGCESL